MSAKPVTLAFANTFGSDPKRLPLPGEAPVLGVEPPAHACSCMQYLLPDGTVWEFNGISPYNCGNENNGWVKIEDYT